MTSLSLDLIECGVLDNVGSRVSPHCCSSCGSFGLMRSSLIENNNKETASVRSSQSEFVAGLMIPWPAP